MNEEALPVPPLHRPEPLPGLSISHQTALVFVLLILLAISNVIVARAMLREFNGVAATVNLAGTLRYLSQRIALHAGTTVESGQEADSLVKADVAQFESALGILRGGGAVAGLSIPPLSSEHGEHLDAVVQGWISYRGRVAAALSARGQQAYPRAVAALMEGAQGMLVYSERLMQSITHEAERRQRRVLLISYLLLVVDALVLMAVFLLVRARIVNPLRKLAHLSRALAAGKFDAKAVFPSRDEVGLLAEAYNDSARKIGALVMRLEHERTNLAQAESMFRGVAENPMVGVYVAQGGRFRYVNAKMAEMFGYERGSMEEAVAVFDLVPEGDRELVESNIRKRLQGGLSGVRYERRARRSDGSLFDVEVFGSAAMIDQRPATVGIMLDITRRKQDEAKMKMAAMVYENSGEAMTITDADGWIMDVNPAFTRITGYTPEEAIGQRISILRSGRQDAAFYKAMWASLLETGQWQGEIWNRRKNGEIYAEWLIINTSYDTDGSVHRRIALFSDITQKKRADELVWHQANFDGLTGLPNRMMFLDRLGQALRKAHRSGHGVALMFIDLDLFKEVNDTLGHAMGDLLLQQAAQRLQRCVRESDTVARFGGDDFTIVLGELQRAAGVERIVQDVLARLAEPFALGDEVAYVSASIGVTFYSEDGDDEESLLRNADQAMYAAKGLGRNRYHYFTPQMQAAAQARRRIANDLRSAVAQAQFELHYQPIVDLRTGAIRKAEALLRWHHPDRGMISPAEFIPIAEETGLIEEIGDWVFREAARQTAQWRKCCPDFQVSINTSPAQFRNKGIGQNDWFEHLAELGLDGDALTIEITEGLLLDSSQAITEQVLRFREAGLRIALDDFGTGYSSLAYLSRLDIDYMKIDRSFVSGLTAGSPNAALCEAMITMAHKLDILVIAEGIETEAQRGLLAAAGCDYGQGYLFSKPIPATDLERHLTKG